MRIVAISGSPRLNGNTNYLVDIALKEAAEAGIETEKIVLSQYQVNPCQGHDDCPTFESCTQKDDAAWILESFRTADGVILATPVYYYNVSAQLKNFLDRNYWIYKHEMEYLPKAAGIIVVAEQMGIEDTVHTLMQFIDDLSASDDGIFSVTGYATFIGDAAKNKSLAAEARELGRQMARYLLGKGGGK